VEHLEKVAEIGAGRGFDRWARSREEIDPEATFLSFRLSLSPLCAQWRVFEVVAVNATVRPEGDLQIRRNQRAVGARKRSLGEGVDWGSGAPENRYERVSSTLGARLCRLGKRRDRQLPQPLCPGGKGKIYD
jgi:hypothetical protein